MSPRYGRPQLQPLSRTDSVVYIYIGDKKILHGSERRDNQNQTGCVAITSYENKIRKFSKVVSYVLSVRRRKRITRLISLVDAPASI